MASSPLLLTHSPQKALRQRREPVWVRFSFAIATCAVAIVIELFIDHLTGQPVTPFLLSFAAIIASAAWAGAGPGLAATAMLVVWSAFDLPRWGVSPMNTAIRCGVFLIEGVLLSIGSSRMWRSMREAATSETWHRQLVETAAEGIWVQDEQGLITYANARMAEMLGLTVDALIGRKAEDFFFPEELSMERVRASNLRDRSKIQFDRRLRRADGSEIWVLTSCNLLGPDALLGQTPAYLAMMTDITERKRAEYALRRSEERFRNLFETLLEGVYQSTPEGRILAANPMILKMFGIASQDELNNLDIARDFFPDPNLRKRLLEQMERDGGYQNVEYELRRRDGQIITVLENARVVRDENGAVLYYEGTMTDITPRRRIEEQLRQAQKVEALGRLAGSIAADFNNSLTVITGYAQLALADLAPADPARQNIERALEAAERGVALTKHLLLFSRRQTRSADRFDLNQAIERCEAAHQSGIALSLTREPAPVYAGQEQIETIVRDLAENLRGRFPSATLSLKTVLTELEEQVSLQCANAPGGPYAVLSIGSANAVEPIGDLLLDPFLAGMEAGESAAAGLSSAHAVIVQCGGFVIARNEGFHVFLPSAAPSHEAGMEHAPGGQTILLVEDEPLIGELSRDMLERQGYRVVLASNAREAEQLSRTSTGFDLLITDAVMDNITGAELARRLRASNPRLKVLYISGYTDSPDCAQTPDDGAFLQKPFSAESLGRKIRQMLNNNS